MRKHTAHFLRLSVLIALAPYFLFAQAQRSKSALKADELYAQLGYGLAADAYKKTALNDTLSMERVANSYRLNGETDKSEAFYERIVTPQSTADVILQYAQVLHSNGKCSDSKQWFGYYLEKMKAAQAKTSVTIPNCAEPPAKNNLVSLANLTSINTDHQEFSAIPFKNGIIFTSTKKVEQSSVCKDCWTKDNFSNIFFAERQDINRYAVAQPVVGKINTRLHDGVVTLNKAGDVMYFSRSNDRKRIVGNFKELKICMATLKDGFWADVIDLPFNNDSFSSCHPTLSSDGKKLYFASNRPGGFGGMDIWMTKLVGIKWSEPENLGETINTSGNEVFPFISEKGFLFFSSDAHESIGGLDVCVSQPDFEGSNAWIVENMGAPFNSNADDLGFSIAADFTNGMLSSSREGGKGSDDIYSWNATEPLDFFLKRHIGFIDATTKHVIPLVDCSVVEMPRIDNQLQQIDYRTNQDGIFTYTIRPEKTYRFNTAFAGYAPIEKIMTGRELLKMREIWLPLQKIQYISFNGNVIEKTSRAAIPEATVEFINLTKNEKIISTTDMDGTITSSLPLDCDFEVRSIKANFKPDTVRFSTKNAVENMSQTLEMTQMTICKTSTYFDPTVFKVGHIMLLDDVLYDYNKSHIRTDASLQLTKVLNVLQKLPSMEVELLSHTDSRGNDRYNLMLSAQRADAAKDFLVKNGIDVSRIIAKGMGETSLTNHCKNGVSCSDALHEQNRRTEVRITKFNAAEVKVDINGKQLSIFPANN
jgi:outer membrane protein OmpA-like peptidoglycan-associated protein